MEAPAAEASLTGAIELNFMRYDDLPLPLLLSFSRSPLADKQLMSVGRRLLPLTCICLNTLMSTVLPSSSLVLTIFAFIFLPSSPALSLSLSLSLSQHAHTRAHTHNQAHTRVQVTFVLVSVSVTVNSIVLKV